MCISLSACPSIYLSRCLLPMTICISMSMYVLLMSVCLYVSMCVECVYLCVPLFVSMCDTYLLFNMRMGMDSTSNAADTRQRISPRARQTFVTGK